MGGCFLSEELGPISQSPELPPAWTLDDLGIVLVLVLVLVMVFSTAVFDYEDEDDGVVA
jgi:hypothetical protein